uniref:Uncharacterized protein n=1 Tax=Pseudomonas phage Cygsa01 TaxID=3138529 RepID=A0AAU6W4D7_9VIRU
MRRIHTLRLGDANIQGTRVPEKHLQLVADWVMDQPKPFELGQAALEFNSLGYVDIPGYLGANTVLERLKQKGLAVFDPDLKTWRRIVENEEQEAENEVDRYRPRVLRH